MNRKKLELALFVLPGMAILLVIILASTANRNRLAAPLAQSGPGNSQMLTEMPPVDDSSLL